MCKCVSCGMVALVVASATHLASLYICVLVCVRVCVWGIRDDGCSMDVIDVQHDCDVNVNFACVCEFARSSLWQKWLVDGGDDGDGVGVLG